MDDATMAQLTDDWDEIQQGWNEDLCERYFDMVISNARDGRKVLPNMLESQNQYIQPVGLATAQWILDWFLSHRNLSLADQARIRTMFPVLEAH